MLEEREHTTGELAVIFQAISDKLDSVKEQNTIDHTEIKKCLNAHEPRIRSLELWRSFIVGGLSALTFLIVVFGIWLLGKVI